MYAKLPCSAKMKTVDQGVTALLISRERGAKAGLPVNSRPKGKQIGMYLR